MQQTPQHIPDIIQALVPVMNTYGYWAVGALIFVEDFGMPVPGETILLAAAFFAGIGHLNIFIVMIVAFVAAFVGDNIGFAIGRYGGHAIINKYGKYIFMTPARFKKLEDFFNRHGGKIIIVARFVDGLRQVNGIIAGLSKMKWTRFISYNSIGAALWVGTWALIGHFGGSHIGLFIRYEMFFTVTVFSAIVIFIVWKIFKHRRTAIS